MKIITIEEHFKRAETPKALGKLLPDGGTGSNFLSFDLQGKPRRRRTYA